MESQGKTDIILLLFLRFHEMFAAQGVLEILVCALATFSALVLKYQVSKGLRCSFSNLDFPSESAHPMQALAINCYSEK